MATARRSCDSFTDIQNGGRSWWRASRREMASATKLPSLRGVLLARTHFEVLGFEAGRIVPDDMTDEGVLAAYRRAAALCHPTHACDALGAQTAFCRVGRAFAALRTADGRERAFRDMCRGRGYLPSSKNPEPGLVTIPWTSSSPVEHSPGVAPPDPLQLAQELERWDRGGSHSDADLSTARDHAGASVDRPFTPPSPTVASAMDVLTRETTFRARERGCPTAQRRPCVFWVAGAPGRGLRLCYRWASSRGLDPDGAWSLGEGGEIRDVTRMRPVGGGGGGASFCVRPADGSGPGGRPRRKHPRGGGRVDRQSARGVRDGERRESEGEGRFARHGAVARASNTSARVKRNDDRVRRVASYYRVSREPAATLSTAATASSTHSDGTSARNASRLARNLSASSPPTATLAANPPDLANAYASSVGVAPNDLATSAAAAAAARVPLPPTVEKQNTLGETIHDTLHRSRSRAEGSRVSVPLVALERARANGAHANRPTPPTLGAHARARSSSNAPRVRRFRAFRTATIGGASASRASLVNRPSWHAPQSSSWSTPTCRAFPRGRVARAPRGTPRGVGREVRGDTRRARRPGGPRAI